MTDQPKPVTPEVNLDEIENMLDQLGSVPKAWLQAAITELRAHRAAKPVAPNVDLDSLGELVADALDSSATTMRGAKIRKELDDTLAALIAELRAHRAAEQDITIEQAEDTIHELGQADWEESMSRMAARRGLMR